MSHFTVLVMGEGVTDADRLEELMLPYHEFECTGIDMYVEEVDITEATWNEYEEFVRPYIFLPDGTRIRKFSDEYNARCFRPATAAEIERIKQNPCQCGLVCNVTHDKNGEIYTVLELPEGAEERNIPIKEDMSFEEWAAEFCGLRAVTSEEDIDREGQHKFGYMLKTPGGANEKDRFKIVQRTNPNSKWDWYQVGGRWSGCFKLKEGATSGIRGNKSWTCGDEEVTGFDGAKKADIDIDAMYEEARNRRRNAWECVKTEIRSKGYQDLTDEELDALRVRLSRRFEELTALWKSEGHPGLRWDYIKSKVEPREYDVMTLLFGFYSDLGDSHGKFENIEDWIKAASPIIPFAMLIDGNWVSRGDMGWFGISQDKVEPEDWESRVQEAIKNLPDDHELVLVDCHI